MGNVHFVVQVAPELVRHGAAIRVRDGRERELEALYRSGKGADYTHLARTNFSLEVDNLDAPSADLEVAGPLFLCVQSGGKGHYEAELAKGIGGIAGDLHDAVFFVEDENEQYVDEFRVAEGAVTQTRVRPSGGILAYLSETSGALPDAIAARVHLARAEEIFSTVGDDEDDDSNDAALAEIARATKRAPEDGALLADVGSLLNENEMFAEALAVLQEAERHAPAQDRAGLRALRALGGRVGEMAERLRASALIRAIGISYAGLGDHPAALTAFERALEAYGGSSSNEASLGNMLLLLGRLDDARKAYEKAARLARDREDLCDATYGMACSLARAGQTNLALGELRVALALDPKLRAHARTDEDLSSLHSLPELAALLA